MPSATPTLPGKQTAILCTGQSQLTISHEQSTPALLPGGAIVKAEFVAINPVDAKMLDYSPSPGSVHGYDFSGTIVSLGSDTPSHLAVGDRVAGFVHGMNSVRPDVGAFAQYLSISAELLLKVPEGIEMSSAAGLGMGIATAGMGLFQKLEVPGRIDKPATTDPRSNFVLVCGGATATGTRAIQLCKLYVFLGNPFIQMR